MREQIANIILLENYLRLKNYVPTHFLVAYDAPVVVLFVVESFMLLLLENKIRFVKCQQVVGKASQAQDDKESFVMLSKGISYISSIL